MRALWLACPLLIAVACGGDKDAGTDGDTTSADTDTDTDTDTDSDTDTDTDSDTDTDTDTDSDTDTDATATTGTTADTGAIDRQGRYEGVLTIELTQDNGSPQTDTCTISPFILEIDQSGSPDLTANGSCGLFGNVAFEIKFAGRADYGNEATGDARTFYPTFSPNPQETLFEGTFTGADTLEGGTTGSWTDPSGSPTIDWTATFEVTR